MGYLWASHKSQKVGSLWFWLHHGPHTWPWATSPCLCLLICQNRDLVCCSPACNGGDLGSIPGLGRSPGEGKGYPLSRERPGEYHGLYSPWHPKELDRTERLSFSPWDREGPDAPRFVVMSPRITQEIQLQDPSPCRKSRSQSWTQLSNWTTTTLTEVLRGLSQVIFVKPFTRSQ